MKVFVIEDNPVYNDYVCNLLKKDSFDTMSAYNCHCQETIGKVRGG